MRRLATFCVLAPPRRRALAGGDVSVRFLAARGLIGTDPPALLLSPVLDYLDRQAERRRDPKTDSRGRDAAEHDQELAEKALARLVETQDRALVPPLVERVGRDHPAQAAVLAAMGGLDPAPEGWDDLLAARMGSREAATRVEAADLARKRTQPAQAQRWVPAAARLLADADGSVRNAAMWAIGNAGGLAAEAVPALVERLAQEADLHFAALEDRRPLHVLLFSPAACDPGVRPTAPATVAIVTSLLARGADANAADARGNTPLMLAADKCDGALLGTLLAAGAKVDARNAAGLTALEMTIWSGNDGLEALIGSGARLSPDKAAAYRDAYKANPKAIALIDKATKR